MKSLKNLSQLVESTYLVTEREKAFIESFGTPDKPVTLEEFHLFWSSLTESERHDLLMDYEPWAYSYGQTQTEFMKPYSPNDPIIKQYER